MTATRQNTDDAAEAAAEAEIEAQAGLAQYNADVIARNPALLESFRAMLLEVPEPDDDATDAAARIVQTILSAETAADLDKPWDSDGMAEYFDQVVIVEAITRRPSDFTGGLGVYLGCTCTIERSGERLFVTCGGVSAVAQLVRAHALGSLPLPVMPTRAKKATKAGYWPYHLAVMDNRLAGGGQAQ
jgi:hypothetical protein